MIKNSEILKYIGLLKVDDDVDSISQYINFLLIDHCIDLCEFIQDAQEKENSISYLTDAIKSIISALQRNTNKITEISLQKEDFQFIDQNVFTTFKYKFKELTKNKEDFLRAYLNAVCN